MQTNSSGAGHAGLPNRGLHTGLWVVQGLLALTFGVAGSMKAFTPIADLAQKMSWPAEVPAALVRFIGACELLGAIGLILPAATRILPKLTPLAASGLTLVMVLASLFHVSRGELRAGPVNFALGALAIFVAWGRFKKAPIAGR